MTESEFQDLIQNCQPHQVFNLDWKTYYSLDFAETFLPKVSEYKERAFHFFDGAELLADTGNVVQKELKLNATKNLISTVFYSYPKGVEAETKKNRVQVEDFAVTSFIEVHQNGKIDISFKFGREFEDFLQKYIKQQQLNTTIISLQNKAYSSTVQDFQKYFSSEISHFNMMNFIGEIIGIDLASVHNKNTLSLKFDSVKAVTSEPSKSTKKIKKEKKQKYITIDFEILNQPVINYIFSIYDGTTEIENITYLPEVVITPNQDAKSITKPSLFEPGKYRIVWDCTNNGIFDTKDNKKKLYIQITARTETGLISVLKISFNIKQLIDKSVTNNFILIVDPEKNESDKDSYIKVYVDDIIARQQAFIKQIPQKVYDGLTDEGKMILNLPIVMVKLGWIYGALCQIHWLEGSGDGLKFPYDFFLSEERVKGIDKKNLQEYFEHIEYLSLENLGYSPSNPDGTNSFLYNESLTTVKEALQVFHEDVDSRTVDGTIGGNETFITKESLWDEIKKDAQKRKQSVNENFFQSFSIGSAFGNKDDVGAALGQYSQRCYYRATLDKNPNLNKWVLRIYEVACRFSDDFSFGDTILWETYSQPLGCWEKHNITDPEVPSRFAISTNKVCVQNIDYKELQDALKSTLPDSCKDFFIYSEMRVFDDDFLGKDILII